MDGTDEGISDGVSVGDEVNGLAEGESDGVSVGDELVGLIDGADDGILEMDGVLVSLEVGLSSNRHKDIMVRRFNNSSKMKQFIL